MTLTERGWGAVHGQERTERMKTMKTGSQFRTASEYKAHVRELLNKHMGEEVDPASPLGRQLHECLSRHDHWNKKQGERAVAYSIRRSHRRGRAAQIFLVFEDLTTVDISWTKACEVPHRRNPKEPEAKHRESVIGAARAAVQDQIDAFRDSQRRPGGFWISEESGERISGAHLLDVDHHPVGFQTLLDDFVDLEFFGYWMGIPTRDAAAGGYRFSNEPIKRSWQEFHAKNAVLRVVTKQENERKPRKEKKAA